MSTVTVTFGDAPRNVLSLRNVAERALCCWGRYGTYELRGWLMLPSLVFRAPSENAALALALALETHFQGTDHHVHLD